MTLKSAKYNAIFRVAFLLLLLSGALLLVGACSSHLVNDEPDQSYSQTPSMGIKVALTGYDSRAGSSPEFMVGEGLENYLDLTNKKFRIYFFDTDNKFIDVFRPTVIPAASSFTHINDVQTIYYQEFCGEIPMNLPHEFKIVALFNWPRYPEIQGENQSSVSVDGTHSFVLVKNQTTIAELCDHESATFPALNGEGGWLDVEAGNLIPFYGVRKYDLADYLKESDVDDDGNIKGAVYVNLNNPNGEELETPLPILRAMAKVEVILTNPQLSFEKVELDKYNPKGFCAPESILSHDSYDHGYNWTEDFVRNVHIPEVVPIESGLPLTKVVDSDDTSFEKWIAYIPEFKNVGVGNSYCSLNVTLNKNSDLSDSFWDKLDRTKKIYFAEDGKQDNPPFDIWRNNIYRFKINATLTSISCIVDVQPFSISDLNPDFGLTRDDQGNVLVRDDKGKLIAIIPYDTTIIPSIKEVEIGNTKYTEVAYNDVIKFREFLDENGIPDGRRQDFLTSGWNIYDKYGNLMSCFIYDTELDPNVGIDENVRQTGKFMEFDSFSNLILEYDGCTEDENRTKYDVTKYAKKMVWAKAIIKDAVSGVQSEVEIDNAYFYKDIVDERPDFYKVYYSSYEGGNTALQTILVVYEVKDGKKTDKILTVLTEEGDVDFIKEYTQIETNVIEEQEGVDISQVENGNAVLRYRFLNNGAYQIYYLFSAPDADPKVYDWDYYHQDGYRFSSFDHSHPRYDNEDVYSRYDKWGNTISRSLKATDNSGNSDTSHNRDFMVIDCYVLDKDTEINHKECKKGDTIIKYRRRNDDGSFNWDPSAWNETYCIGQYGSKIVLI